MNDFPSYLKLYEQDVIEDRLQAVLSMATPCMLCPRQCMADRAGGDMGYCRAPYDLFCHLPRPISVRNRRL